MPKKIKSKTTVNVDAVRREASRMAKEVESKSSSLPGPLANNHSELSPGTLTRESPLEQSMGSSKYKKMIHDHNDKNKHILDRLPFTFPRKSVVRSHLSIIVECVGCGYQHTGSENTYGIVCPDCKTFRKVKNPEADKRRRTSVDPEEGGVGMLGTASDLLELREKRKLAEEKRYQGLLNS
jgi:hypothetical protein